MYYSMYYIYKYAQIFLVFHVFHVFKKSSVLGLTVRSEYGIIVVHTQTNTL